MRNVLYTLIFFLTFQFALNAQGPEFAWVKQMGGAGGEVGNSITLDNNGNIYTTGSFFGTCDFDPGSGTYNLTSFGYYDIFVSKIDASGNFLWAKQMGGADRMRGYSIAVDNNGNVYTTGDFYGTCDFDPGSGTYNLTSFGLNDIFVSKLDASGNFVWAKQIGGAGYNYSYSIAVDNNGNVCTTGEFAGTCDFDPGSGVYNLTSFGNRDIFISKLDVSGNFVWGGQLGGADSEGGRSIAVDGNGNVYTTSSFSGTADFDPGSGTYNLTSFGYADIFVSKLDASGNFLWAIQMGGTDGAGASSITVDDNGNVYTTGAFSGTVDFDPGSVIYNNTSFDLFDIFVSKLDASGNFVWAKQMGGAGSEAGRSITVDGNENVCTTGIFDGTTDFNTSSGTYNLTSFGYVDIFVSKLDASGNFVWAKQMGGPDAEEGNSIAVDNNGNVYTTGRFNDTCDFDPSSETYNLTSFGDYDVFVEKFSGFPTPFQEPFNLPEFVIQQNWPQAFIGDPIQLGTGSYSYSHEDFKIPSINGPLKFARFYNSLNNSLSGPLGYGWSHTYNYFLTNRQDTAWDIHHPDGHLSTFIPMNSSGQSFPVFSGTTDSLQKNNNNRYSLFTKEKIEYRFDSIGKLDSIIDLNGNITKLFYTGSKLDSVLAPGGRSLIMTYDSNRLVSVMDPLDRICLYSYDADSNLIRVFGANMDTTSFTYDSLHRILAVVNPLWDTILTNNYDSTGRVVSQEDVYNNVTSIAYDFPITGDATVTHPDNSQMVVHHDVYFRKTSEIDELNFTKTYTYDINSNETEFTNENNHSETRLFDDIGNLLSDTLPGGQITNITYNNFNSPVQITDANGNVKLFYRDSVNNNLDSILNPDGSSLIFTYDSLGLVTQSIDGNGNITSYLYSAAGDLLSIQTATGIKQFTYDAAGRKLSSTDENGHTTTYVYDNNDNLLLTTDALGRTIQNTYDANNQLLSSVDKNGYETTYSYDGKGRKISTTDPKGGVATYTYDVRDRLVSATDPESNTMLYSYDAKGRKIGSTNALGTTQYQYDAVGNLVKVIDPTSKITDYTYTPTNKKQSQIDGLSNTISFSYDLNDNLISVLDPLGRATAYGYDAKSRLISVTDAASNTTTISYDFNDNKIAVTDPLGHTQTYNYDAANRLVSYEDAAGNSYTYSYDSVGNNLILTKPTGTITKVYDAANRTITTGNSTGNNYSYAYDNNDNVLTMSNTAGTSTMTYDSLNQLIQYLDPHGNLVSFNYDSAGNKTSIVYPGNKIVSYAYDGANNLTCVTDWLNQTFTYAYDSSGRTSQLTYPNGISCEYGYDNAGRLDRKITRLSSGQIISGSTLTLDEVGNRVSEHRLAQVPAMLPSISRAYSYGNDDNMTSDSVWNYTNDNSGNRIAETDGTGTATYNFLADNLLNSRMDTSGTDIAYTYDPLGHRISKAIGADVIEYVLDLSSSLSHVLQITDSNGVVQSSYVYGHGLLERIDTADIALFYHFDAQHNTVLLTDQDTVLKDFYTYDPFGAILSHSGTATQPFTFLGEYGVELESPGVYYARARYYDAINGRFISKDAYDCDLNNPQTINRYVYSVNRPISIFDYTGLFGEQDNDSGFNNSYSYSEFNSATSTDLFWIKANNIFGNQNLSKIFTVIDIIGYSDRFIGFYNGSFRLWSQNFYGNQYVSSSLVSTQKGIFNGLNTAGNIVGAISTGINLGLTIDRYKSGQINEQQVFKSLYPDLAEIVGGQLFGPIGGLAAKTTAGLSVQAGERIGQAFMKTSIGNKYTNWLANTFY